MTDTPTVVAPPDRARVAPTGRVIVESERLRLREFTLEDASHVLRMLNEPSFIDNIADRGVRDRAGAEGYLREGPLAMYADHGLGLYRIERRRDGAVIGLCGLLRREELPDPDLGFALLPEYWGRGYATEAGRAAMDDGRRRLAIGRIVAIANADNSASRRVLERLGFERAGAIAWSSDDGEDSDIDLYVNDA